VDFENNKSIIFSPETGCPVIQIFHADDGDTMGYSVLGYRKTIKRCSTNPYEISTDEKYEKV
jgi:hypothetical protein